jgi:ferredoxin
MCGSDKVHRMMIPPFVAQKVLSDRRQIYLRKCPCRVLKGFCPPELWEVCLLFEDASEEELLGARPITQQEAQDLLQRMAGHRAIHNLFFHPHSGKITELCSCCTCCCRPLLRLKEKRNYAAEIRSGYLAITDERICTGCGNCLESCFFEARQLNEGSIHLVAEQCFGCGRCIEACPQDAIRLEIDPAIKLMKSSNPHRFPLC